MNTFHDTCSLFNCWDPRNTWEDRSRGWQGKSRSSCVHLTLGGVLHIIEIVKTKLHMSSEIKKKLLSPPLANSWKSRPDFAAGFIIAWMQNHCRAKILYKTIAWMQIHCRAKILYKIIGRVKIQYKIIAWVKKALQIHCLSVKEVATSKNPKN